jgi:hypothetical protein
MNVCLLPNWARTKALGGNEPYTTVTSQNVADLGQAQVSDPKRTGP